MERRAFWIAREERRFAPLRGRKTADVAVVGGGFSGLTTALWLARSGLRVALVEAEELCGGASGQCGGVVSVVSGPGYMQLEKRGGVRLSSAVANTRIGALKAVRSLAEEGGIWQETSLHLLGDEMENEAQAMQRAGLPVVHSALLGMGMIHPLHYAKLLTNQCQAQGVELFEHSRVIALETNEVATENGRVEAPYIVIATGYPIVNIPGWYFLRMMQHETCLKPLAGTATFEGALHAPKERWTVRSLANGAIAYVDLGPVGAQGNQQEEQRFARITAATGMQTVEERYVGLTCHTMDGLPYIGPYGRRTPNMFVASGYGTGGIVGSMLAAQAITARVLGLPSDGYEVYSPQRKMRGVSMTLTLGTRYVGSILRHPSAPRCPHLGCRLVMNPRTKLWECPCHGSRFDDVGHVQNAPSVRAAELENRREKI